MAKCKALLLLILITFYLNNCLSQGNIDLEILETDSLAQLLETVNGKNKFPILLELAKKTLQNYPDSAAIYMNQAEEWIDEKKKNKDLFQYYMSLSAVKLAQDLYKESITLTEKACQLDLQDLDPSDNIEIFKYMAKANLRLGEKDKAQQAFFKGLRIADSLHLDNKVSEITNAIGVVYLGMDDYEMSEKYFLLAIEKAEEIEDEIVYSMATQNLAIIYSRTERYDEAEKIILDAIDNAEAEGSKSISVLGANYNNLTIIYEAQNKIEEAVEYMKKALAIAEEMNELAIIAMSNCNLGQLYGKINNYKLAKHHLDIGLQLSKSIENKEVYNNGLLQAAEMYKNFGRFEDALDYHIKYSSLKDSLLNEKRIQVIAEVEEKYEATKKELEIISLSSKNTKAQNKLKLLRSLIFGLCFGLLGFIAFIYFIKQNHRKNLIIKNKNLEIASDKIEILEQSKEITKLSSLIKGQEYERERIAKELHDGLGGLLAISHSKLISLSSKKEPITSNIEQTKNLVGEAYDQVKQISHNLMPLDLDRFGLITTLENMISLVNSQNDINMDFRTYNFDLTLSNDLGLNIYRIVQEAVTNILKYAKAKNVLIELIQHENHISLSIEDDGIGFDLKNFKSGNGIQNMRNRSEILNGSFNLESHIGEGTSISVKTPLPEPNATPSLL